MIKSDNEEYFIEPLERGKQMEEEKGRIHVVYKRSAVEQASRDVAEDFYYRGRLLNKA